MLEPLIRAVAQLNDRVFLGVVWRSLALSALAFLALLTGSVWLIQDFVGQGGWLGWVAGLLGALGVVVLAIWLFVPVALVIATFYVDRVAAAVERRFYPDLPPARPAPISEQVWDGVVLGLRILVLQIVTLIASVLLPGIGLVLSWAITGWAMGRGLFVAVAMRRMTRPEALDLYARERLLVFVPGVVLAIASTFPPLNLLVPVVGIAAMVHVLYRR
ncbi:MAG TPA: EI24 domain-containing protein [Acetobacteraceae bacterium]|nr:EI24 domain-containing protein [Acetobacteraceae bacterium]